MLIDPISTSNSHLNSNSNYSKMINTNNSNAHHQQLAIKINGATLQPPTHPPPPLPTSQIPSNNSPHNNQQFMHSGSSSISNSSNLSSSSGPVSSASSSSSTTPSSSLCNHNTNNLNENELDKASSKLANPKFITINHSNFPYSRSNQNINDSSQVGRVLNINNLSKEFHHQKQSAQSTLNANTSANYQNYTIGTNKLTTNQHKPQNLVKPSLKQPCSSISMKNINEISNQNANSINKNDYNLQLALKAATAALQKSKITASSTIPSFINNSNPLLTKNNNSNLKQSIQHLSESKSLINSNKNQDLLNTTVSQSQKNLSSISKENIINNNHKYVKQQQQDENKLLITPSVSTNSLNISIKQGTESVPNQIAVNMQASQSLFQPYNKLKQKVQNKLQVSTASQFLPVNKLTNQNKNDLSIIGLDSGVGSELGSTMNLTDNNNNKSRLNTSNSSNNSIVKLYRTSLIVDNNNNKNLNKSNNKLNIKGEIGLNSSNLNATSSSTSFNVNPKPNQNENKINIKKVDTSDYDNLEEDNINISVNLQQQQNANNYSLLDEVNLNNSFTSLGSINKKFNSQLVLVTSDCENDSMNYSLGKNKTGINSSNVNSILKAAISNLNVNSFNYSFNNSNNTAANNKPLTLNYNNIKKNKNNSHHQGILKRQKSASTEFLNITCSKSSVASFGNSSLFQKINKNLNSKSDKIKTPSKDYENLGDDTSEDIELTLCNHKVANAKSNSPQPPQIQPFSGVLSKSLFSVVLKPQPVKPIVEPIKKNFNSIKSPIPITLIKQNSPQTQQKSESSTDANFINPITESQSSIQTTNTSASLSSSSANGIKNMNNSMCDNNVKKLKKKCVSTTNLKYDSLTCSSFFSFNDEKSSIVNKNIDNVTSSKSVSFLSKIDKNDDFTNSNYMNENYNEDNDGENSSENSINIDDASHNQMNNNDMGNSGEIEVLDNEDMQKNKKIIQLEEIVRVKTNEIDDLKRKLKLEIDKHQMCAKQRNFDLEELEEEKQIYEQKLNSIRAHFNQQLKLFEQNERILMQDKLNNLQEMHNELKANYKKNLDAELKHLRVKLNESQTYAAQLVKQLQMQTSKTNILKPRTNTIGTQTYLNDSIVKLENNLSQNELIFYLKKLKSENNELRFQLDSERRFFQNEKDKWLNERKLYSNNINNNKNDYTYKNDIGIKVPLQIQHFSLGSKKQSQSASQQPNQHQQQQLQQSVQQQLQKNVLVNQQNII